MQTQAKNKRNWRSSKDWQKDKELSEIDYFGKVPPYSKEVEEVVLGAIMLEKTAFDKVSGILKPESFYLDSHRKVYESFQRIANNGSPIDLITVANDLHKNGDLELIGGPQFISRLTINVSSSANLESHAQILSEKSMKRELIKFSTDILQLSYDDSSEVRSLLDRSEKTLFGITNINTKKTYQSAAELGMEALSRIEFLRNHPQDLTGIPTGYRSLDRITCGWQPSDLIIIAARPSVGKTALALNLARNAAKNGIKPTSVGFFSLEMSSGQLIDRIISADTEIFLDKIKRGRVDEIDLQKLNKSISAFENLKIYIDDTAALNIFELRSKVRRMVSKHGVGLIILDYLQLMSGTEGGNREQEISTISRNLKGLAKELNIPVIALSQMSREIEKRKGPAQLSDLRESGAIEQDADFVAFLSRDDYQQNETESDPQIRGNSYMDIKKHRNGDLEKLPFKTDLRIQTWFEPSDYDNYMNKYSSMHSNWKPVNIDYSEPKTEQDYF